MKQKEMQLQLAKKSTYTQVLTVIIHLPSIIIMRFRLKLKIHSLTYSHLLNHFQQTIYFNYFQ